MNWKVGMKARLRYVRTACGPAWRAGIVVTITALERGLSPYNGNPFECRVGYSGRPAGLDKGRVLFDQLEPLTPDLGSWDEIARSTGWHPERIHA